MTFPTVTSASTTSRNGTSSVTASLPASITAGDVLVAFVYQEGTSTWTATGWTTLKTNAANSNNDILFARVATADASDAFVLDRSAGGGPAGIVIRRYRGVTGGIAGVEFAYTTIVDTTPDSPSLTPSWGAADTRWETYCRIASALTGYPTNYTLNQSDAQEAGFVSGCRVAGRERNIATEDPPVWPSSIYGYYGVGTVAIRGTAGAGSAPIGTVTIGTITPSSVGGSIAFTYDDTDETGFEYTLDAGTSWASAGTASPFVLTGQSISTAYTIAIRAINSYGNGTASTGKGFTTTASSAINRSDNFNRTAFSAIGTPSDGGSAWQLSAGTTWGIGSGGDTVSLGSGSGECIAVLESGGSNVDVQVTFAHQEGTADCGLVFRHSDDSNFLMLSASSAGFKIQTRIAGAYSNLTSIITPALSSGDVVKVTANGTDIEVFVNGTSKLTTSSSFNQTATKHGFRSYGDVGTRYDDFSITQISSGSPPAGTVTIGTITPSSTGASVAFTYSAGDQTGYDYTLNAGTSWASGGTASPLVISGQTSSTPYTVSIRAKNASGNGTPSTGKAYTTSAAAPVVVKGAAVTLYSGVTAQASLTGITAMWWDASPPTANPVVKTTTTTDGSGVVKLNVDASTALSVGGTGFLMLYKAGATATDDLIFAGRIVVSDIS